MGGPVLGRHQRQVQHLAARELRPQRQAGAAAGRGRDVVLRDGERLVQRQSGLGDDQRRHQLGDRRDRQHGLRDSC
jgi:hypothetical protein